MWKMHVSGIVCILATLANLPQCLALASNDTISPQPTVESTRQCIDSFHVAQQVRRTKEGNVKATSLACSYYWALENTILLLLQSRQVLFSRSMIFSQHAGFNAFIHFYYSKTKKIRLRLALPKKVNIPVIITFGLYYGDL